MSSSSFKPAPLPGTSLAFNKVQSSLLGVTSDLQKTASKIPAKKNPIIEAQQKSKLYDSKVLSAAEEKKPISMDKSSLGKGWFGLQTIPMTETLKRDLQVIQMRNYMDPKRFYKNPDKPGPIVGVGTVVEGNAEYKSSRLTNKERKQNITEEILADDSIKKYSKRVFMDIQDKKSNKRKVYKAGKKDKKKSKKFHAYF